MVTWHALLCALAIIVGACVAVYGGGIAYAASMADAPSGDAGKAGCTTFFVGIAIVAAGIVAAFL